MANLIREQLKEELLQLLGTVQSWYPDVEDVRTKCNLARTILSGIAVNTSVFLGLVDALYDNLKQHYHLLVQGQVAALLDLNLPVFKNIQLDAIRPYINRLQPEHHAWLSEQMRCIFLIALAIHECKRDGVQARVQKLTDDLYENRITVNNADDFFQIICELHPTLREDKDALTYLRPSLERTARVVAFLQKMNRQQRDMNRDTEERVKRVIQHLVTDSADADDDAFLASVMTPTTLDSDQVDLGGDCEAMC